MSDNASDVLFHDAYFDGRFDAPFKTTIALSQSLAPSANAPSLAHAICGWIDPQTAISRRNDIFAPDDAPLNGRDAVGEQAPACSSTLVAWLTTAPGNDNLARPAALMCFTETFHSCSCRTLPASTAKTAR